MGCDIHMFCEVNTGDGWRAAGRIFKNEYDRTKEEFVSIDEEDYAYGEPFVVHPYRTRNYDLFGILADVRNGTWGEPLKPIALPKGIPKDVSPFVKKEYDKWDGDAHSASWLSLKELEDYDWDAPIHFKAMVSQEQADELKKTGKKPDSYSVYSSDGVTVEWDDSIREHQTRFINEVLPQLNNLERFGQVRIVFWFDN